MGYIPRQVYFERCFVPDDTVIVANDPIATTQSVTYVKIKEITLFAPIVGTSKFRFVFDLEYDAVAVGAYAQIYRNGVAIGTEQNRNLATFATFTEDINVTNWKVGDKVQLYAKTMDAIRTTAVRNFRISGIGSEFANTLV